MGFESLRRSLLAGERVVAFTRADDAGLGARMLVWPNGQTEGTLGAADLDREALALATAGALPATGLREIEGVDVFVETYEPLPRLFIVGAVHVAIHLVHFARRLGFRTVVVDARSAFATAERFSPRGRPGRRVAGGLPGPDHAPREHLLRLPSPTTRSWTTLRFRSLWKPGSATSAPWGPRGRTRSASWRFAKPASRPS